ncbi:MAG TPA: hypothetical protein VNE16_01970 [Vicinamibacterales bacterium]|nr:hypothetical protein [Vicinamibacterales bacterium]
MLKVVIIGAGDLGGALAFTLARHDRVGEVRLVDAQAGIAAGKALDILQSGPIERFGTRVTASDDVGDVVGSDLVVIADRAGAAGGEWTGDEAVALLDRLAPLVPRAPIVCAGAAAAPLIEQGVSAGTVRRGRLFGSAPEALAASVRAMVALEINGSPDEVSLAVAGVPPAGFVVGWSDATIGGANVARVLTPPALARLTALVPRLWPPGPVALASAAARVADAIAVGSRRQVSCFVVLDGELGARRGLAALSVRLGPRGLEAVALPALSAHERTQLDNAIVAE